MKTRTSAEQRVIGMLAEIMHQIDGIEREVSDHPELTDLVPASIDEWHRISLDTIGAINESKTSREQG